MENNIEIWKNIEGYPNYQVSNLGRVKRLGKILKQTKHKKGYLKIGLSMNGISKVFLIHRLVASAFIPNIENKPEIDHINTDKTDNRVENLRWVTHKENCNNLLTLENYRNANLGDKNFMFGKKGKQNHQSKPILQFTLNGEFIRRWDCIMDISRELGCSQGNIQSCCRGRRKTCGGYIWRYYDLETYLIGVMNNNIKRVA